MRFLGSQRCFEYEHGFKAGSFPLIFVGNLLPDNLHAGQIQFILLSDGLSIKRKRVKAIVSCGPSKNTLPAL